MRERHVTEIPADCSAAVVVALRETDGETVQVLKWQPVGEPRCNVQLALLLWGIKSAIDEVRGTGREKLADRLEGMFESHSLQELIEIFSYDRN